MISQMPALLITLMMSASPIVTVEDLGDWYNVPHGEASIIYNTVMFQARKYSLDPNLIFAIIKVESNGKYNAVSHAGAIGLMQVMPKTGKWIGEQIGEPLEHVALLKHPALNIKFGVWYLNYLLRHFDGNITAALSGYYWGPGRIAAKLRKGLDIPSSYALKVIQAIKKLEHRVSPKQEAGGVITFAHRTQIFHHRAKLVNFISKPTVSELRR
jgi:soluble lytic murein transglycosylase-like protein